MENPGYDDEAETTMETAREADRSAIAGRRRVTGALLVAMMVTAVEQLVVSPAMPTIIAHLKGFDIYPWVISAYLLASTVSTPIYGKLADLFGRKRVLIFGLMLFSLGSILSGTSQSMGQLIAMRSIQGLGAGAVGPIVLTMLGDLFTLKERAQVQGLFSAVWGLSSVGGPLVGGYLADHLGWQWVFLVCVPFALAAIVMLLFFVSEPKVERKVAPIDWAGAVLLTSGMSTLLWVVLDGSRQGLATDVVALGVVGRVTRLVRDSRADGRRSHPADGPDGPADDRGLAGGQLSGRRHPVWAGYLRAAVRARSAGRRRDLGGPCAHAAVPGVGGQRRRGRQGRRSLRVSPRGDDRLGAGRGGEPDPGGGRDLPRVVSTLVHRRAGRLRPGHGADVAQLRPGRAACRELGPARGRDRGGHLSAHDRRRDRRRPPGATLGWGLAHRLARAGATGIDVVAALRPETHESLSTAQLALVQSNLGLTLRDVYLQMTILGIGCLVCAFWLPDKHATLTHSRSHEREVAERRRARRGRVGVLTVEPRAGAPIVPSVDWR